MKLDTLVSTTRTLATTLRGMAELGLTDRGLYDRILCEVVRQQPEIYGVWTVWEPGAIDGRDRDFRNRPGHNASGRYLPFWFQDADDLRVEPNTNYDVNGLGDYYQIPRETRIERSVRFSEYIPLSGERHFFTCHIVPILRADRFLGVVGIDVDPEKIKAEDPGAARERLSEREEEVLEWVAAGKTNAEIAIILGISPHTVKHHVARILEKLNVENRRGAMRMRLGDR